MTLAAGGGAFIMLGSNPIRTDHAPAPLPPSRPPPCRKPRPRLADGRAASHRLRARPCRNRQDQARGRSRHAGGALSAALGLLPARSLAPARGRRSAEADAARPGLVRGSVEPALQSAGAPARRRLHRPDVARRSSLRSDLRARPEFLAPRQGRAAARSSSIWRAKALRPPPAASRSGAQTCASSPPALRGAP